MEAPSDYKTAGIFMLISGVLSVLLACVWLLSSFCMFMWAFLSLATGITEIIFGIGILQGSVKPSAKVVAILGLIGSLLVCDWIGVVMEILAIVWLGKPEVQGWLESNR